MLLLLLLPLVVRGSCVGSERTDDALVPSQIKSITPWLSPEADRHYLEATKQREMNAQQKMKDRELWLLSDEKWQKTMMWGWGWILFTPYWTCPWTLDRSSKRVTTRDGPKWTCGLPEIQGRDPSMRCIVYSFGSRREVSFETRVKDLASSCEIHIFDMTMPVRVDTDQGPSKYHCTYLQATGNKTLPLIMHRLGHDYIDFLKMDIERSEWAVFDNVDWTSLRIGQIAVELHPYHTLQQIHRYFSILEDAGFRLLSIEPVNFGMASQDTQDTSRRRRRRRRLSEEPPAVPHRLHPPKSLRPRDSRPVEVVFLHRAWTPNGFARSLLPTPSS